MFKQIPATKQQIARRKPIYGVGINDAWYRTTWVNTEGKRITCPFYSTWYGILERCYSPRFHAKKPSYKGATLEKDWEIFSNFRAWMAQQPWEGRVIDKDLIDWEMKHYGPDNCLFITPALNNLLTLRQNDRGKLPIGVSEVTINGYHYYVASCSIYGKQKRLGYFKTPEEANKVYRETKLAHIQDLAKQESDPRVKQALLNIY